MLIIIIFILISTLISVLLFSLCVLIGKKKNLDKEKKTSIECGFNPIKKARIPFSLRFFVVTIIFLIFDVEIAILLPLVLLKKSSDFITMSLTVRILILIIFLGLLHEWNQGSLNWIK